MFRRFAAVLAVPLFIVSACAKEGDDAIEVDTDTREEAEAFEAKTGAAAASALRAAPDAATEAGTARFEIVMEMVVEGQTLGMTASGAYDAETERTSMRMDMGSLFEGLAETTGDTVPDGLDATMEMVQDGETFYMRSPIFEMITGSSDWLSMTPEDLGTTAEGLGLGAGTDFTQFLDGLRGAGGEPEVVGENEDVRGVPTTHYATTIDLAQALEEAPAEQREELEAAFEQLGDGVSTEIPVDVWIDADDLPRRIQMDMGSMFESMGLGGESTMVMTMDFFDYGEAVEIVVPDPDEVTPFSEVVPGGFEDEAFAS